MIFMAEMVEVAAVTEKNKGLSVQETALDPTPEPAQASAVEKKKAPRKRNPKTPSPEQGIPQSSADAKDQKGAVLLFKKYSYDVEIMDPSLRNYINLRPMTYPNSFRRTSKKMFSKASINIVERLANDLMRGGTGGKVGGKIIRTKGRLQGKKTKVMTIIEQAFEIVHKQTGKNPLQLLVNALEFASPIEDTTRVRYGGIISNVPVDISASRRLDIAIRNLAMATIIASFANRRDIVNALASELVLASKNDITSYAIKRKNEIERMARSAK